MTEMQSVSCQMVVFHIEKEVLTPSTKAAFALYFPLALGIGALTQILIYLFNISYLINELLIL